MLTLFGRRIVEDALDGSNATSATAIIILAVILYVLRLRHKSLPMEHALTSLDASSLPPSYTAPSYTIAIATIRNTTLLVRVVTASQNQSQDRVQNHSLALGNTSTVRIACTAGNQEPIHGNYTRWECRQSRSTRRKCIWCMRCLLSITRIS